MIYNRNGVPIDCWNRDFENRSNAGQDALAPNDAYIEIVQKRWLILKPIPLNIIVPLTTPNAILVCFFENKDYQTTIKSNIISKRSRCN